MDELKLSGTEYVRQVFSKAESIFIHISII